MALLAIRGTGASPGIGRGPAHIYQGSGKEARPSAPLPRPAVLPEHARPAELQRLRGAISLARTELDSLRARVDERLGPSEAAVFEAQALLLEDPAIGGPLEAAILG